MALPFSDVSGPKKCGKFNQVSGSYSEFLEIAETTEKRKEWFVEQEARIYAQRGLVPSSTQCIGFGVPAVFAEVALPTRPLSQTSTSMFLSSDTCIDKSQVCRTAAK
jgi:hypothetical protein